MGQPHSTLWPVTAATISGSLWLGGAFVGLFMAGDKSGGGNGAQALAMVMAGLLLPFIIYSVTRQRAWMGVAAAVLSPFASYALTQVI